MHDETCPSVAHVLDRIDGGLVRVRFAGGRLSAAQLRAVADAAVRFGSGTIEITNRANLQLRGIRCGTAAALAAALTGAGVSSGAAGDLRRNVLAGPLAGLDPTEMADTGPLVDAIVARLEGDPVLDGLSPKAGVVVDGGGVFHLGGRRDDVVVTALGRGRFALFTGGRSGLEVAADAVPAAVHEALLATLEPRRDGARHLAVVPLPAGASAAGGSGALTVGPLGPGPLGAGGAGGATWVGAMPPLGRMSAAAAAAVADLAGALGDGRVRLTPWRGLVLTGVAPSATRDVVGALEEIGMLSDPSDPQALVVACAGSPGCTSGHTDAPADALAVAGARRAGGAGALCVHVSGCPKRCAQRAPAAVTLIGLPGGGYDVLMADPESPAGERLVASGVTAGTAVDLAVAAPRPATTAGPAGPVEPAGAASTAGAASGRQR